MNLYSLFRRCLYRRYTTSGRSADYDIEFSYRTVYIYFQASNGLRDWKNNLDFPARIYKTENGKKFYAHRGFLSVWESIREEIDGAINDKKIKSAVCVGYSHGAALALLCYEYLVRTHPDIKSRIYGYGFGCPRVVWGAKNEAFWHNFTVIRNIDDIVTHLPPAALGYRHVGQMLKIGRKGAYSPTDAHRPENIMKELCGIRYPLS